MTAGREDERWVSLPLDLGLDFDASDPEPCPRRQLPEGCSVVTLGEGRRARSFLVTDLPDIAEWTGECRFYAA